MNIGDAMERFRGGESLGLLAVEAGVSRVTLWRQMGRPARWRLNLPTATPDPTVIAWAAGFFDGEGCVSVGRDGHLAVTASQVVPDPLFALSDAFGGTIRGAKAVEPNRQDQWQWRTNGEGARRFLVAVRPYLRVKGRQADLAFELMALPRARGLSITPAVAVERERIFQAVRALNRRGRVEP